MESYSLIFSIIFVHITKRFYHVLPTHEKVQVTLFSILNLQCVDFLCMYRIFMPFCCICGNFCKIYFLLLSKIEMDSKILFYANIANHIYTTICSIIQILLCCLHCTFYHYFTSKKILTMKYKYIECECVFSLPDQRPCELSHPFSSIFLDVFLLHLIIPPKQYEKR